MLETIVFHLGMLRDAVPTGYAWEENRETLARLGLCRAGLSGMHRSLLEAAQRHSGRAAPA